MDGWTIPVDQTVANQISCRFPSAVCCHGSIFGSGLAASHWENLINSSASSGVEVPFPTGARVGILGIERNCVHVMNRMEDLDWNDWVIHVKGVKLTGWLWLPVSARSMENG